MMLNKISSKVLKFVYFSIFIIVFLSCNSDNEYDLLWKTAQEDYSNKDFNSCLVNINTIITDNEYFGDLKPESLFLASEIYLNEYKENDIAITFLDKIINNYPNHLMAKRSLFTKAYIHANYIESFSEAIALYNQFIVLYPEDDLISSVQYELEELKKHESTIFNLINN